MSQAKRPSPKPSKINAKSDPNSAPAPAPLKPRKTLFILLCVIFAGWMAFLIALYFRTVRRGA